MRRGLAHWYGVLVIGGWFVPATFAQTSPPDIVQPLAEAPAPPADAKQGLTGPTQLAALNFGSNTSADESAQPVKVLSEGPLHEAFLSPSKAFDAERIAKQPPTAIVERPGIDPPDPRAQWIDGYWDWDASKNDFVWVTGTWRVAPPGRFWVNGYWKRDDKGWYRVDGFWSDRKTDRLDYRKDGPPAEHPADDPGPSPDDDHFYVPGQYFPDGNGVIWKPGYWAKTQPGWSWVPAQWVKQPEGWTFQDGFWDRILEDRGTLFAPAEVAPDARNGNTVFQPYTQVSPQSYGTLYGAFGRPNSNYDGYPGCAYDANGRYYGYAQYGNLGSYYGYLDYPFYGGFGYPYVTSPVVVGTYGGYGLGGFGGFGLCGFGIGVSSAFYGVSPYYAGFGYGYPYYGGFGYGGFGYGGFGLGMGLGLGLGFGFGYPFYGFGFGYPLYGWGGYGGGWGNWRGGYGHRAPFYPGGGVRNVNINRNINITRNFNVNRNINVAGRGLNRGGMGGQSVMRQHNGVMAPPSSRAFGNAFQHAAVNGRGANAGIHRAVVSSGGSNWNNGFNGVRHTQVSHASARSSVAAGSHVGANMNGVNRANGGANLGNGGMSVHRGVNAAGHAGQGALAANRAQGGMPNQHLGAMGGNPIHPGNVNANAMRSAPMHSGAGAVVGGMGAMSHLGAGPQVHRGPAMGNNGFGGAQHLGGMPRGGGIPNMGGFSGGGMHMGGYGGGAPRMGGFSGGGMHMGGGGAPHMGGFSGGGGMHMGGGGGHMGGGGHGGGGHR